MSDALDATQEVEDAHAFRLPHTAFSRLVEGVVEAIGNVTSWLWAVLVVVILVQVFLRYVLSEGSIMLEELQWHIYGVGLVLGLSYCFTHDRHVRVDVLAERWPPRRRAWIELIGLAVFVIPFSFAIVRFAIPFVYVSWQLDEISAAPGGLPYRWIPKSFMIWGFLLLLLAALARLTRTTALLFGRPRPIA